jgi:DNA-binding beta-propeller fold protein YncE
MKALRCLAIAATLSTLVGAAFPSPSAKEKPKNPPATTDAQLLWPPPPSPAKIKWVGEWRSEFDVGAKKHHSFMDRLAGKGEDALWLKRPVGVAVDEKGILYVGDLGQGVVAMDPIGHRMWLFSAVSKINMPTPSGLAADSKGVYACDSNTSTLALFDKEGHLLKALGPQDGIQRPVGVAVDEAKDLLVVVNGGEHSVLLMNRQLGLVKKIGGRGDKEGQFNYPTYCCIIPGTGFAVTDTGNFRVQIFDYEGHFIRSIGKVGDVSGNFARPKGIAVDPDNNLYVVDAMFANFQIFKLDGQVLTFVGNGGAGPAEFQVPASIAIGKDGSLFVADEINRRVQVFKYLGTGGEPEGKR